MADSPADPYESRRGALIALQVTFIIVALSVYSLRIYTRACILRSIGPDDYIMGIAMLLSILLSINACLTTKWGWAAHLVTIPEQNFPTLLLLVWISELLFTLTTSFVKLSILFFYLRLAIEKKFQRVVYGSIVFVALWLVAFTCVDIFQCVPISDYWVPTSNRCFSPGIAFGMHGITNSLTDVYVFVLPMRMAWKLHLPRRQRIWLLVIFGLGFLVCVAGALRLYFTLSSNNSDDKPWEGFNVWTWEGVEVNLGIVCASAPCLKALVMKVIPTIFSTRSYNGSLSLVPSGMHQPLSDGQNSGSISRLGSQGNDLEGQYIMQSVKITAKDEKRGKGPGESRDNLTDDRDIFVTTFDCKTVNKAHSEASY